jgi:hypothetical protein
MYAEALNELNNGATADAVNAVKTVRMRAFKNDESKIGTIPTTYQAFKDYIIEERKLELSNEGLRKTDLARWGILVDHLTAEKAKLVQLAKHEGKYANVERYRAYKLTSIPCLDDPTIALDYIPMTEDEVASILTADQLNTLHVLSSSAKGYVVVNFYEDKQGNVSFTKKDGYDAVSYTILNMFGIHSIKQKGNLCVEDVDGISTNNTWITGATGIFYGLKKNMVEILPFNTTSIIDVNPGLANEQHPCY